MWKYDQEMKKNKIKEGEVEAVYNTDYKHRHNDIEE